MIISWLISMGLGVAAPPDKQALVLPVGTGEIGRLHLSPDGNWLTGRDQASGDGFLLDVDLWAPVTLSDCSVAGVAAGTNATGADVWVACTDGTIRAYRYQSATQSLAAVPTDDSELVSTVSVDVTAAVGLWYDDIGDTLFMLDDAGSSTPTVLHAISPTSGDLDADVAAGFPLSMLFAGFNDAVFQQDTTLGDTLFIVHQSSRVSRYELDSGQLLGVNPISGGISVDDVTPAVNGSIYGADRSGGVVALYQPATGVFQPLLNNLTKPDTVVASFTTDDEWLMVSQEVGFYVYELNAGQIVDADNPVVSQPLQELKLQDAVIDGDLVFGGGIGGNVKILTAAPFVTEISISPTNLGGGEPATLTFTVDEAADWVIYANGDRTGSGTELASGKAVDAGEVIVELPAESGFVEGENRVYVLVSGGGQTTHRRVDVTVDTPPPRPDLKASEVGFRSQALVWRGTAPEVADLANYQVWVTTTPFTPEDYATGGPEFDGSTNFTAPVTVAVTPGEDFEVELKPLQNDVLHYIAVRAVDQGGLVSPLSRVVSATPQKSYSASELAGEKGGAPCQTGGGGPLGLLAIGVSALLMRRRRGMAAAVGLLGLGLAGTTAEAGTTKEERAEKREMRADQTPVVGNFEARYGFVTAKDDDINSVYDASPLNMMQIEFGPQLWRVLELDAQLGYLHEGSVKKSLLNTDSVDRTVMNWFPIGVSGTFRLQILDEQVLVPFARFGFDYVIWNEKYDESGGKSVAVRGAKMGTHYGFGLNLLLDTFDRRRASLLEAQTGINDTFLTFEWRRQVIDARTAPWGPAASSGLSFSGDVFSVGIKLDY